MSKTIQFQPNVPVIVTLDYDTGKKNDPHPEHPEWGESWSWGCKFNGEQKYFTAYQGLNDALLNASVAKGVTIKITKIVSHDNKTIWNIEGVQGSNLQENSGELPTPQSTPKNAGEPQTSSERACLAEQSESEKENWIKYLACLKCTNPIDSLETKILEAVKMERVLRRVIETRVQKKIEVTGDDVNQFIADLEVPF